MWISVECKHGVLKFHFKNVTFVLCFRTFPLFSDNMDDLEEIQAALRAEEKCNHVSFEHRTSVSTLVYFINLTFWVYQFSSR